MNALIKSINPATRIESEDDALAVARASSIALLLSGAKYLAGAGMMVANFGMIEALAASQVEAMGPGIAAEGVAFGIVAGAVVVALVEIGAGIWQWKRPGVVVPIIWLLLIAYGAFQFISAGAPMAGQGLLTAVLLVVFAVLHASAIRGARALDRFRDAQAY